MGGRGGEEGGGKRAWCFLGCSPGGDGGGGDGGTAGQGSGGYVSVYVYGLNTRFSPNIKCTGTVVAGGESYWTKQS